jgi:hypothetical protein
MTEVIKDQVDFHQPKAQAKGIQIKLEPVAGFTAGTCQQTKHGRGAFQSDFQCD